MKFLRITGGKESVRTKRLPLVWRSGLVAVFITATLGALPVLAADPAQEKVLRVCQDPNNLPFSSRNLTGFENKIAALFAQELGWKVAYTWYPQRMGFVRNTLKAKELNSDTYKCDLVTGVAVGFDLGATTQPYYRSTYAMAYVKGKGLDEVKTLEDLLKLDPEKRKTLRLGVFGRSPVVDWLLQNGLIEQMVSYQTQTGDPDQYPGEMVEKDLVNGTIDVAFAWGPIAGYFSKKATSVPIVAIPFKPRADIKFDFSIAMAVRFGEKEFKERIDQLIEQNQQKITAILEEYGVPLINERGELVVQSK
ncbi:MAG: quinoprotein dehydrogenase-associated putative ABC transporter substrate-binding protein [Glaciimonas sp.]|nr:quinoprotein dehydrogenase-associated putative ABC transporter substrate-binding protein [Glaciimonas sp.]